MASQQGAKRWAVPLALMTAGAGYTVYADQQQGQQNKQTSNTTVNLDPIRYDGKELQVQLKDRNQHLQEISKTDEYDVIVIGGGCNGSGVFLEAANRGLKCLLVESNDFAAATSSKSTKLIHGGVRYLQEVFEFSLKGGRLEKYGLVKEALKERTHFVENAFYMNRQIPFVVPTTNIIMGAYYYIGVLVYHAIYWWQIESKSTSFRFKLPQWYGSRQLHEYFPNLDQKFKYGIVYYDGQFNDARMNMDILLTGTQNQYNNDPSFQNGNILNYAEVQQLVKNEKTGENNGVVFKDKISGYTHTVKAKCVVNCAGAFADKIRQMDNPQSQNRILSVAGSHMTMPQNFGARKHALVIPETQDGRILFLVPWQNHTIIGTTERKLEEPELNPTISADEMLFMAKEVGNIYSKVPSTKIIDSIQSKWTGIRPLILVDQKEGQPIDTKKLARTHVIEVSKTGLISLIGGKWTVYRKMGEETVDEIFKIFKCEANKQQGYKFPPKSQYVKIYANALMDKYEIEYKQAKYLIKTYGMRSFDILNLASQQKNKDQLMQRIHPNHPQLKAEILYHIKYEMAQYPIDVLFRRTRMGFVDRKSMFESLNVVCDIFAQEFKWDDKQKQTVFLQQQELMRKMDF